MQRRWKRYRARDDATPRRDRLALGVRQGGPRCPAAPPPPSPPATRCPAGAREAPSLAGTARGVGGRGYGRNVAARPKVGRTRVFFPPVFLGFPPRPSLRAPGDSHCPSTALSAVSPQLPPPPLRRCRPHLRPRFHTFHLLRSPSAARFRLKKLRAETAAKAAAAASSTSSSERSKHAKESYDAAEFGALSAKYESLSWRIVSKPGGATVKPDEFYELYGLAMQASQGDNTSERPMWAEKGGLDFEGRARWDAWTAVKGMPADEAKLKFVKTYWEFPAKALYSDGRA